MSLLTDTDRRIIDGLRAGVCTGDGPCITTPLGTGKNWVTETGGLDPYLRALAHAFQRKGHSESEAIQLAVGVAKRWAAGGGKVTAATRARAAKAVAHWEAMKAASHSRSEPIIFPPTSSKGIIVGDPQALTEAWRKAKSEAAELRAALDSGSRDLGPLTESSSAGGLLPKGPSPKVAARVVASQLHAFRGRDLEHCAVCGLPASAPIHLSKRAALPKV